MPCFPGDTQCYLNDFINTWIIPFVFVIVLLVIGTIQVVMANVVEPAIMGRSLNLSPLVVIASLMVWGTIWGVVGMFLCVPIMVVVLIVLAHFEATRPVAVLLSADGKIPDAPNGPAG